MDNKEYQEILREIAPILWIACWYLVRYIYNSYIKKIDNQGNEIISLKSDITQTVEKLVNKFSDKMDKLSESIHELAQQTGLNKNDMNHLKNDVDELKENVSKNSDEITRLKEKIK